MNFKLLHDWSDGIKVVVGPGREGMATWACPLCHCRFDGVRVRSSEHGAIALARLAFQVHLTSTHAECIKPEAIGEEDEKPAASSVAAGFLKLWTSITRS
ncbi:hypothetical protein [Brevifollis gellanilyticus]|nr:hypothetical protein [Brevifollis gellanilyticus]